MGTPRTTWHFVQASTHGESGRTTRTAQTILHVASLVEMVVQTHVEKCIVLEDGRSFVWVATPRQTVAVNIAFRLRRMQASVWAVAQQRIFPWGGGERRHTCGNQTRPPIWAWRNAILDRKGKQSEHLQVGIVRRRRIVTIVRATRAIVIVRLAIAAPTTQHRLLRTAI